MAKKRPPSLDELDLADEFAMDLPGAELGGDLDDDAFDGADLAGDLGLEETTDDDPEKPLDEQIAEELTEVKTAFQQRAKREEGRFYDAVDSEYWFAICFQTRDQKEEFLRKVGWPVDGIGESKYLNGLDVARKVGVKITAPSPKWRAGKPSKRLKDLT